MPENVKPEESRGPEDDDPEMADSIATENLKAIKLLHQILMVVAAAVLAFALRPDLSTEYRAALDELAALKELSFNSWPTFIIDHYKKYHDENNKFVISVIRLAGVDLQGHPRLVEPTFGEPPPYLGGAKIIEFDAFFSGTRKIGSLMIEGNKKYMAEQLKKAVSSRNPHPSVAAMSVSGVGSYGYYGLSDWTNVAPAGPMSLSFGIYDQPQTTPNGPVFVIASYTVVSESGDFALEWLRGEKFGTNLIDPKTNEVFPHLKVFWDRVSSMTYDQATVFLQDEISASGRGALSFFGIPVERDVALSAGPAVCLSILLFLALHLKHLRSLGVPHEAVESYPWIALFRGPLGLAATYFSVLILPVSANATLLHRYGHTVEVSTRIGWGLTVVMFVTAVWTLIEIHRLRRGP